MVAMGVPARVIREIGEQDRIEIPPGAAAPERGAIQEDVRDARSRDE
jgi:hypothetical protein